MVENTWNINLVKKINANKLKIKHNIVWEPFFLINASISKYQQVSALQILLKVYETNKKRSHFFINWP